MPLDVFSQDAFKLKALTHAINSMPYQPTLFRQMGLVTWRGVSTTSVMIESQDDKLNLIQSTPRGTPLPQRTVNRRKMRSFPTVRIGQTETITADQVQNVRAFGTEDQLLGVQQVVNDHLAAHRREIEFTVENLIMGAAQGEVRDADGTVLYSLFDEFGVVQPTEVDFELDDDTPDEAIKTKCHQIRRTMAASIQMGGVRFGITALCSNTFFDALVNHAEVTKAYEQQQALRDGQALGEFNYGGIRFLDIQSADDASTSGAGGGTEGGGGFGIQDGKVHFIPTGVPDLFVGRYGPGEFMDTVNTLGLPFYARQYPTPSAEAEMGRVLMAMSYPLVVCTRPKVLIPGIAS